MARARFFPVSAQMCHDPALTGPSLHRGRMRRCHSLNYSAAIERFTTGAFASNFARCVEKNVRTLRMFDELAKSRLGNSLQAAMSARSALENSSTLISSATSRS
jgi:hypothetical protein